MLDGLIQLRRHQIQIDVACDIPPGRMTDYKETFSQNHPAYGLIRDVQMKQIKNQTIKKTLNIDIQKSFYFETDTEISGNQQETIEAEKDKKNWGFAGQANYILIELQRMNYDFMERY